MIGENLGSVPFYRPDKTGGFLFIDPTKQAEVFSLSGYAFGYTPEASRWEFANDQAF